MSCTWPVDRTCYADLPAPEAPEYAAALATQNASEDMAIDILYKLSGQQFGTCDAVARPCPERGSQIRFVGMQPWEPFVPVYWGGAWLNLTCGCAGSSCAVTGPRVVHLPGPVQSVESVHIGDELLAPSGYVLEGDVLYRIEGTWPGQDMGKPLGENGTWSVEYTKGYPPPAATAMLVALLAKEFVLACTDQKCRLPRNVTNVTRNGVSYQVYDPAKIFHAGKTGLAEIDLWLSATNPHVLQSAPSVI